MLIFGLRTKGCGRGLAVPLDACLWKGWRMNDPSRTAPVRMGEQGVLGNLVSKGPCTYVPVGRKICRMWRNRSVWLGNEKFYCYPLTHAGSGRSDFRVYILDEIFSLCFVHPFTQPYTSSLPAGSGADEQYMLLFMFHLQLPTTGPSSRIPLPHTMPPRSPRTACGATPRRDDFRREGRAVS